MDVSNARPMRVGKLPKVSYVRKVREIKEQLRDPNLIVGLFESVALSARNPFVSGVANLQFAMVAFYNSIDDYVRFDNYVCQPVIPSNFPSVYVNFKVVRKNCAHLFTFYIESSSRHTYEIGNNDDIRQTFMVEEGSSVVHFVFMPTKTGDASFQLFIEDPTNGQLPWIFRRVEIDVVT